MGILGAGAWGTALAIHTAKMGHDTLIYARETEVVESINDPAVKENTLFLKVCLKQHDLDQKWVCNVCESLPGPVEPLECSRGHGRVWGWEVGIVFGWDMVGFGVVIVCAVKLNVCFPLELVSLGVEGYVGFHRFLVLCGILFTFAVPHGEDPFSPASLNSMVRPAGLSLPLCSTLKGRESEKREGRGKREGESASPTTVHFFSNFSFITSSFISSSPSKRPS